MPSITPPRFVTRTMATTFTTVVLILVSVLVVVRPDGKGYPDGLRGDEIPVLARLVHVVDAFDAMSSARAYRPARSGGEARQELWRCAGSQFDAEVVQALATAIPTLRMDDNRYDTAAARAARKRALVAFSRP